MTQDEIIEMARQAGFEEQFTRPQDAIVRKCFALSGEFKGYKANNAALEAFAKLVAAKEREACAKAIDEMHLYGFADVREFEIATLQDAAKAIRARGEA